MIGILQSSGVPSRSVAVVRWVLAAAGWLVMLVTMRSRSPGIILGVAPACLVTTVAATYLTGRLTRGPGMPPAPDLPDELVKAPPDVTLIGWPGRLLRAAAGALAATIAGVVASLELSPWWWPLVCATAASTMVLIEKIGQPPVLKLSGPGFVLSQSGQLVTGRLWTDCAHFALTAQGDVHCVLKTPGRPDQALPLLATFENSSPDGLVVLLNSYLDGGQAPRAG